MGSPQLIVDTLHGYQFSVANERELQEGILRVLSAMPDVHREVILDERSRIDFLVGDIGIEVKVDGSLSDLMRQVARYTKFEQISEIIVVTTRSRHLGLPAEIGGKRVHLVFLGDSSL